MAFDEKYGYWRAPPPPQKKKKKKKKKTAVLMDLFWEPF